MTVRARARTAGMRASVPHHDGRRTFTATGRSSTSSVALHTSALLLPPSRSTSRYLSSDLDPAPTLFGPRPPSPRGRSGRTRYRLRPRRPVCHRRSPHRCREGRPPLHAVRRRRYPFDSRPFGPRGRTAGQHQPVVASHELGHRTIVPAVAASPAQTHDHAALRAATLARLCREWRDAHGPTPHAFTLMPRRGAGTGSLGTPTRALTGCSGPGLPASRGVNQARLSGLSVGVHR